MINTAKNKYQRDSSRIQSYFHCKILEMVITLDAYAVAQLDEALRYKPEGRGFDSLWYH